MSESLIHSLQALLQQAALHTDAGSLALAVLALGLMPFLFFIPATASGVLVGALLPAALAIPVILLGFGLNTTLTWILARTIFGRRLEAWVEKRGGTLGLLREHARESPFKWAFISRYIPAPFIAAPLVLAGAGVPLGATVWGSTVAMLPWAFAYAWAGRAGREGSLQMFAWAGLLGVLITLLAFWLRRRYVVPVAEAKKKTKRNPKAARAVRSRKSQPPRRSRSKA